MAPKKSTVSNTISTENHPFFDKEQRPGTLIVVEGPDGSGKSTQIQILQKLLEANGFFCYFSAWNSSEKVKPLTKQLKNEDLHAPATVFDMVHAADLMERYKTEIEGKLRAGMVVLCDRYVATALARGGARGLPTTQLKNMYDQFFVDPDITLYFRLPVDIAISRVIGRSDLKHYEAGMDQRFSPNIFESFSIFQKKVIEHYDACVDLYGMYKIDGTKPVYETTPLVFGIVADYFYKKYDVRLSGPLPA